MTLFGYSELDRDHAPAFVAALAEVINLPASQISVETEGYDCQLECSGAGVISGVTVKVVITAKGLEEQTETRAWVDNMESADAETQLSLKRAFSTELASSSLAISGDYQVHEVDSILYSYSVLYSYSISGA
jgi:hypothetical protein